MTGSWQKKLCMIFNLLIVVLCWLWLAVGRQFINKTHSNVTLTTEFLWCREIACLCNGSARSCLQHTPVNSLKKSPHRDNNYPAEIDNSFSNKKHDCYIEHDSLSCHHYKYIHTALHKTRLRFMITDRNIPTIPKTVESHF